ncbi:MAG: DUF2750 domain-containing protein, partial [bacterium]
TSPRRRSIPMYIRLAAKTEEPMSQAASQYAAFWRDVKRSRLVWTVKDDGGFPAPKTRTGQRAMPFWSTLSRVQRIIKNVPAYGSFVPHEMSWEELRDEWLLSLSRTECWLASTGAVDMRLGTTSLLKT